MKKEGYIEVNYQIAVIMNESGLLRNTYSISSKSLQVNYYFVNYRQNNSKRL